MDAGGTLLTGGGPPSDPDLADAFFYSPTVVVDPPHDSPMAVEEVFGVEASTLNDDRVGRALDAIASELDGIVGSIGARAITEFGMVGSCWPPLSPLERETVVMRLPSAR